MTTTSKYSQVIVDGEYLLYKDFWQDEKLDVINCCRNYVQLNYVTSLIVSDVYESIFIKDHGHAKKMPSQQQFSNVFVTKKETVHLTKKEFMSNVKEREKPTKLLMIFLTCDGHKVITYEAVPIHRYLV